MNKTYAFSDIHSQMNLWKQIKNYVDDTDTIYFLGDACDRGDAGLKLVKEILEDNRVIYLLGNHEEILIELGQDLLEDNYQDVVFWMTNGGAETFDDFQTMSIDNKKLLLHQLKKLPTIAIYQNAQGQNIILTHSGYSPNIDDIHDTQNVIWNRSHLYDKWTGDTEILVHGHTPVPFLNEINPAWKYPKDKILKYCDGHKINIDMGCFETGVIALLDLDTLEPIYFYDEAKYEQNSK